MPDAADEKSLLQQQEDNQEGAEGASEGAGVVYLKITSIKPILREGESAVQVCGCGGCGGEVWGGEVMWVGGCGWGFLLGVVCLCVCVCGCVGGDSCLVLCGWVGGWGGGRCRWGGR